MKDVQNLKGDYKFGINEVGVENIKYPLRIKSRADELISTVGTYSLGVNLEKELKGIHMSRLPQLLAELDAQDWVLDEFKSDIRSILEQMQERMKTDNACLELEFDYFWAKEAPVSKQEGLMSYSCEIKAALKEDDYEFFLSVEVPVTSLCPCSKEISNYSAHNQRGYTEVTVSYDGLFQVEELIEIVNSVASCEVYSVLKRVDEKEVTEKAYDNPRFVEDMVRLVAEKLTADERINWFRVNCQHQESIHPHDAYAVLEGN
jgi:GTP cyclohydrolase I